MTTTLEGSTALVTGATAGIGRAIAQQLAALGAKGVVHGRSPERGAETVRAIEDTGGCARVFCAGLSRAEGRRCGGSKMPAGTHVLLSPTCQGPTRSAAWPTKRARLTS